MAQLGRFNELRILERTAQGALLEEGPAGALRLPEAEVPEGARAGDLVSVFLYLGPGDRLAATTIAPAAQAGEVAYLKVVKVGDAGAFLNWGLPKDLLLPWTEVRRDQKHLVVEGRKVLVMVFIAKDGRLAASARLEDFLEEEAEGLEAGAKVVVIVSDRTEIGMRVVVDHRFWGLVHDSDIFGTLHRGQRLDGFIRKLRPDGRLDVSLSEAGYGRIDAASERIMGTLTRRGGFLAVGDKTAPEEIYALFGVSKKVFKQTLGALYRQGRITLEDGGIRRVPKAR